MLDDCDLLIFDCDGVLVDSEVLAVQAFVEVLQEAGVKATAAMVEGCFGMKQADILLRIAEHTGQDIPAGLPARLWPATEARFKAALQPMPGLKSVLAALPPGLKRCVASSSSPERIAVSLALTGLAERFGTAVFSSHQVARGKPAPDLFLFAAATLGVAPGRCLVVEDSVFGVEGARAAGMRAVGFVGGSHVGPAHGEALLAAGAASAAASWAEMGALWGLAAAG